jgi:predicted ATPase/class 3 adenylate cyclase
VSELPTGTVTFVFTDIEGSTRLQQFLGDGYAAVLAGHRRILREAFSSAGGVEVDTQGDAFFYVFARAQDAVSGAINGQRALAAHCFGDSVEVRVRMGIHTGEPDRTDEGYVGADVHLGSRICSVAWGGQIVVSSATAAVVSGVKDVRLQPLGKHALKDIDGRHPLHQVLVEGLRHDFPALRSVGAHPTNLPPRLPVLIGRNEDIMAVSELLSTAEEPLVTLAGPGGAGKTRLSLAVAERVLPIFADGVFFVDLSALIDPSLVTSSIAQVLSVREAPGRSVDEALIGHLASKKMLLVLDNFEQVMEAASRLSSLLEGAAALQMLVTSREGLRISSERVVSVSPLPVPRTGLQARVDQVADSPAVALFVARAQAVKADFALTEDNAGDVAGICQRLDGLPLAIELAAARINLLTPSVLLSRLDQKLKVLSAGRREAPDRQRSLRGAIAWSYQLLSADEQRLFRRLGVFAAGWTLEAAEAVCDRGHLDLDVLDGLGSLVDKSLIRASGTIAGRFTMLETIHDFVVEKLQESDEVAELRLAHAQYFQAMAQQAEQHLIGEDQKEWLDRLDTEHDNFRAALAWSIHEAPELASKTATALWRFWDVRGHITEGRQWLHRVLHEIQLPSPERMRASQAAATLADSQDDHQRSIIHAQEALSLARDLGDNTETAIALISLGAVWLQQGDVDRASSAIEEAAALAQVAGNRHLQVRALCNLANVRAEQQRDDEAVSLYEDGAALAESSGDRRGLMMALISLGEVAAFNRRLHEAKNALQRVIPLAQELSDGFSKAAALINLGIAELLEGENDHAMTHFHQAMIEAAARDSPYLVVGCLDGMAAAAMLDNDVGKAACLFAASDHLRADAGIPRSSGEETLYQPYIDALPRYPATAQATSRKRLSLDDAVALSESMMSPPR